MDKTQLVSIIMPMYNCEKYVREAVLSVTNQTYKNWELIICDDCSSDNSHNIVKELAKNDKRIKVVCNDKNYGTAASRNKCLDLATGEYICLLDSDDTYDPTFIEKQLNFALRNGPFVFCSFRRLATKTTTNYIVPAKATYNRILKGSCLSTLSVFISKDLIGNTRFKVNSEVEDFLFFLELLKKTDKAIGNKEVLATYRIIEGSKSRNKGLLAKKMWKLYRKDLCMNFFECLFYFSCWAVHGVFKYINVR